MLFEGVEIKIYQLFLATQKPWKRFPERFEAEMNTLGLRSCLSCSAYPDQKERGNKERYRGGGGRDKYPLEG